jgi:hypothetical protein
MVTSSLIGVPAANGVKGKNASGGVPNGNVGKSGAVNRSGAVTSTGIGAANGTGNTSTNMILGHTMTINRTHGRPSFNNAA